MLASPGHGFEALGHERAHERARMTGKLDGKVAVVTGGASGMGRSTVLRFLDEGARVLVADLNEETGKETVELAGARGAGERVRFIRTDVAEEADARRTLRERDELVAEPAASAGDSEFRFDAGRGERADETHVVLAGFERAHGE